MKYTRRDENGGKSVVLTFEAERRGENLTDTFIRETMKKEGLRRSEPKESMAYSMTLPGRKPTKALVLFDNIQAGESEAKFVGHVTVTTEGNPEVVENWTRGNDDWDEKKYEFLFSPIVEAKKKKSAA